MFVVAYPRETLEMVLDAHNRAFTFFGGVTHKMVYDNLKTVVDAVLVGKERQFNRRFQALANTSTSSAQEPSRQCARMAVHATRQIC